MNKLSIEIVMMDNGYVIKSIQYPKWDETKTIHGTVEEAIDKASTLIAQAYAGFKSEEQQRLRAADNSK